jgi:adenylate cyclase
VFEVVGRTGEVAQAALARLAEFDRALALHDARDFAGALKVFRKLAAADPPSKVYAERCEAYIATPPPADWQGEFVLKTK